MYQVPSLASVLFLSHLTFGLRFASLILLALIWFLLKSRHAPARARWVWLMYCVCLACFLLGPVIIRFARITTVPIIVGAFAAQFFFWAFSRCLFDDHFRLEPGHGIALAAIEVTSYLTYPGFIPQLVSASVGLVIVVHALRSRRGDLLEQRRRFAFRFVCLQAVAVACVLVFELCYAGSPVPQWADFVIQSVILLVLGFIAHELAIGGVDFCLEARKPPPRPAFPADFVARFNRLLNEERVYLRSGLNLKELSRLLKKPEYLTRQYINEHLGFRNFNDFINTKRTERACQVLSSPEEAVAVTTLAFDVGFSSLATFNRAFRHYTGTSPTLFRETSRTTAS